MRKGFLIFFGGKSCIPKNLARNAHHNAGARFAPGVAKKRKVEQFMYQKGSPQRFYFHTFQVLGGRALDTLIARGPPWAIPSEHRSKKETGPGSVLGRFGLQIRILREKLHRVRGSDQFF